MAPAHQAFLEEVDILLSDDERAAFLALTKDYQREAFIERFWDQRDPNPRTAVNEFREAWQKKVAVARERFEDLTDARSTVLLLNGVPDEVVKSSCPLLLWPLEVWFYARSERVGEPLVVAFYRKWGGGWWRLWSGAEGIDALFAQGVGEARGAQGSAVAESRLPTATPPLPQGHQLAEITDVSNGCGDHDNARKIVAGLSWILGQGLRWNILEAELTTAPEEHQGEWVATFAAYSTDVAQGVESLAATLALDFPGRQGNRTVVQGVITVPAGQAQPAELGAHRSYTLLLTGEVLSGGILFESFRYRFDVPAAANPDPLPLVFQRQLRPGPYTLIVKVEDVASGKAFRAERELDVPALDRPAPVLPKTAEDVEAARLLAEASAALSSNLPTVSLLSLPDAGMQTGFVRFDALVTGSPDHVVFSLDGKPLLTKKGPPYSVELDLGPVPRTRVLAAAAFDAQGELLDEDELVVNAAGRRFAVRLTEPRRGKRYRGSLLARAEAEAPIGERIERVELYLNEALVATLYQPPYVQPIVLPAGEEVAYVRAVAYLPDGNATESLVFVNAPANLEEMEIDFVELYAAVLDRQGRPVLGLSQADFAVREDGTAQEIARFERVRDLPIHVALVLDVSASMAPHLERAQAAALSFLETAIGPKDRGAVITFHDHPWLAVRFTNDREALAGGLAGLKAERGTALFDSLVFTLYCFNGVRGQRAALILSDGRDEGSRFSFEQALEYARRAGVAVYTVGLGEKIDRKGLEKIAEETGGRAFFPKTADELAAIYAAVEGELRAKYLVAYQSTNTRGSGFRTVDLTVARRGVEVKAPRGYYP